MYRQWSLYVSPVVTIYTAQWSLYIASGQCMYRQWSLYVPHSGHYMYRTLVNISTARCHYMYRQWSLYVPPKNPTFNPHSSLMCFVWISEQTAIISLYNINWLVCITETECVYCAVRTACLYITQVKICTLRVLSQFRRLIASLSRRWPRFDSRPVHMRFVVDLWH